MKSKLIFTLFTILTLLSSNAGAQQNIPSSSKEPLEITADGTLEWHRNDKNFIATKNALAKQGEVSIAAATLTAHYREVPGNDMEIWQVTAKDNVVISSRDSKAYGQNAEYDLDKGFAVMTGNNLKMESADQTVTARDRFEYWTADGRLVALGRAKVIRPKVGGGTDTLEADKVSAVLKEDAKGQRVLHSLEAEGNVVITTPTETVTGAYGIYKADTNKAELTGQVTITRGPNTLEGTKAEVDLNTNTSRMFGSGSPTGRVRGVFYPGSEKKPEVSAAP
jgi:lipopolysaccharide export system protein LptA